MTNILWHYLYILKFNKKNIISYTLYCRLSRNIYYLKYDEVYQNRYHTFLQLRDLVNFLVVAFFIVAGVGIYYHANLWPDDQLMWNGDWTDWRIWTILYYPYWQLYGEMNLDILEGITNIPV